MVRDFVLFHLFWQSESSSAISHDPSEPDRDCNICSDQRVRNLLSRLALSRRCLRLEVDKAYVLGVELI